MGSPAKPSSSPYNVLSLVQERALDDIERILADVRYYELRDYEEAVRRWRASRAQSEQRTQRVCRKGPPHAIAAPLPPVRAVQHATTLLDRWKLRKSQVSWGMGLCWPCAL